MGEGERPEKETETEMKSSETVALTFTVVLQVLSCGGQLFDRRFTLTNVVFKFLHIPPFNVNTSVCPHSAVQFHVDNHVCLLHLLKIMNKKRKGWWWWWQSGTLK